MAHLRGVKGEVKVMAGDPVEAFLADADKRPILVRHSLKIKAHAAVFARTVGASRIIPNVTVRTVKLKTICLIVNYYIQSLLPTVNGF